MNPPARVFRRTALRCDQRGLETIVNDDDESNTRSF